MFIQIPLKFVPKGSKFLICRLTCEKPLLNLMLTKNSVTELPFSVCFLYCQTIAAWLTTPWARSFYIFVSAIFSSTMFDHFYETALVNDERIPLHSGSSKFKIGNKRPRHLFYRSFSFWVHKSEANAFVLVFSYMGSVHIWGCSKGPPSCSMFGHVIYSVNVCV